jgi:nitroimidazol reductase NimA-like FMN-containing flavoprotein (pyridoxamine 5'-phosphate oxidase superfamily)
MPELEGYETTEESRTFYKVYGLDSKGMRVYVCENGYNPYEWRSVEYFGNAALIKDLKWAQSEADHAPKNLHNVKIEKVKFHKYILTKREVEIIEYEPKGLEPIIPF